MDQIMLLAICALTLCICLQSSFASSIAGNPEDREHYQQDLLDSCLDDGYHLNVSNTQCYAERLCIDVARQCIFECIKYSIECCKTSEGIVTREEAPRGTLCCSGAGMYSPQTHSCFEGELVEYETTRICPNSQITKYNIENQICCEAPFPGDEPNVYLLNDNYICCGGKYINTYKEECCANQPIDLDTQRCKDGVVTNCGSLESRTWNATTGFHVTVFEVGNPKKNRKRNEIKYTLTSAKQLLERNTKLQVISTQILRSIYFHTGDCFAGTLQPDEKYILLSKTKLRKNIRYRENRHFILALESSDVFSLLYGSSQ